MRLCILCHPHRSFTNKGWYTHMARKHKIKVDREIPKEEVASTVVWDVRTLYRHLADNAELPPDAKVLVKLDDSVRCPHPFCAEIVTEADVLAHVEKEHPEWKRIDGRFVFETV